MSEAGENDAPQRRRSHVDHGTVYASVGATASPDVMRFPPSGSTPYEFELRIGSGAERFLVASTALMTWGAQTRVGIRLRDIEQGDGGDYTGVEFDEHGTPQPVAEADAEYGPDGQPFVAAGTMATLHWPDGRAPRRLRVVYTVNEPRRMGFAWGTADDHGVIGEELFTVEHRDDDTVWATVRGFLWEPERGILNRLGKSPIKQHLKEAQSQLAALVTGVLPAGG